jgi:hypothetical protein
LKETHTSPNSVIPAQAGIQKRHRTTLNLFYFAKYKDFATIFFAPKQQVFWGPQFEQARKRQRTCHAVVSCILVFLFCFGRCGTQLLQSNNFKQVLTLYPHKIKNTSATQMRGFKDYYLFHCFVALRLAMIKYKMDSRLRGNDGGDEFVNCKYG